MTTVSTASRWTSQLASRIRSTVAVQAAPREYQPSSSAAPPPHHLILYEYEASPWCRLIREYATILDLQLHIRPCPRQTLWLEGAFDNQSRFRPEAMKYLQNYNNGISTNHDLTFPLLVDQTASQTSKPMVILQSYDILQHLWENYGRTVLTKVPRPDQQWNSNSIPFALRFLLLAAPSYLRPWPTCGLLRTPSIWPDSQRELVLYQSEACPESRLVRETLCTLEIPYLSIPMGMGSSHQLPDHANTIPVLVDGDCVLEGARNCQEHLWKRYKDPQGHWPQWWDTPPKHNLGRAGSFSVGAYTAFVRGKRAFVPDRVFQ